jgi:hypothetical protein
LIQSRLGDVGLEWLGQGFPAGARFAQLARLFSTKRNQLLQVWSELAEIRRRTGLLPAGIAPGLGLGQGVHQIRIQALLTHKLLSEQFDVAPGRIGSVGGQFFLGSLHEIGIGRSALPFMQLTGQQSQLFATPFSGCRGHGGVLIEIQGALNRTQQPRGSKVGVKLLGGGCHKERRLICGHSTVPQAPEVTPLMGIGPQNAMERDLRGGKPVLPSGRWASRDQ